MREFLRARVITGAPALFHQRYATWLTKEVPYGRCDEDCLRWRVWSRSDSPGWFPTPFPFTPITRASPVHSLLYRQSAATLEHVIKRAGVLIGAPAFKVSRGLVR